MITARPPRTDGTVAVIIGAVLLGVAGTVWAGAALAALLTGFEAPAFGSDAVMAALTQPQDLRAAWGQVMPSPVIVWAITGTLALVLAASGLVGWHFLTPGETARVHALPGAATRADIRRVASARTLRRQARHLRPSLAKPTPADVGHRLGRARGGPVWTSCEDSMIVLGPTRSGKGLHVVIDMILDAPGAVVTTSTRPDNLAVTLTARSQIGPVAVFDPQRLAAGVDTGLRWSPVRGCEVPQTAMIRAKGLASDTGFRGVGGMENGAYWQAQTEGVLRGLLHAAALDGRTARDLYRWSLDPVHAAEAVRIMHNSGTAATGWADALDATLSMDERTRSNIWSGVRQALGALADPRVLDAVTPTRTEQFDPATFIAAGGTLFMLGTSTGAGAAAAFVNAFVEDTLESARRMAASSPGARLDPPLSLILDEIGNLVPIPSLPALMAEGGGSGLTTTAILQSRAQARERWGEHAAATIWDAATVQLVLGGGSNAKDLQDLSALIGERDDKTISTSWSRDGNRSSSTSVRRVPIIDTGRLRTLPFGTGVLMMRSAAPIVLTMTPWTDRPDADRLERDRKELEARMGAAARGHVQEYRGSPAATE